MIHLEFVYDLYEADRNVYRLVWEFETIGLSPNRQFIDAFYMTVCINWVHANK